MQDLCAVLSEGTHTITASVTDSAGASGSASITIVVGGGQPTGQLVVGVSTDKEVYSRKGTVIITVTVDDESGAPIDGAAVGVTVRSPNGTVKNLPATTNNGVATLNYSFITRRDGSGVYKVNVTATKDGYDPGSAYTEFVAN